jgi:hypothetical protein
MGFDKTTFGKILMDGLNLKETPTLTPGKEEPPTAFRLRVLAIARAAIGNPRFEIRQFETSLHLKLDGWDVATLDGNNGGMNSTQMDLSEQLLGLASVREQNKKQIHDYKKSDKR